MSIAPSIFVSSTCYDLKQERMHLEKFIKSLEMIPLLSEFSSFPVNPNLDAIENCLARVKESADIFVLIVGGRYGEEKVNGKSVTNLEYLQANFKGIPCYAFVQKRVWDAFFDWQKNPSGNFADVVDSPKIFEFVESLSNPGGGWVFSFESARDITETLQKQLAYLLMETLKIWTKFSHCDSPKELQNLSAAALLTVVQKPSAWEGRLFSQVLCDEISGMFDIRKDFDYGITLGKSMRIDDPDEIIEWIEEKFDELQSFFNSAEILVTKALPNANNLPSEQEKIKEIAYTAQRLAKTYRRILEWAAEFRNIQTEDRFSHLMELISRIPRNVIDQLETFSGYCDQQIDDAVRRFDETNQPQTINFTLTPTFPDLTELYDEFSRLKSGR